MTSNKKIAFVSNPSKWLKNRSINLLKKQYTEFQRMDKIQLEAEKAYCRKHVYLYSGGLLTIAVAFIGIAFNFMFGKDFRGTIRPLVLLFNEKGFDHLPSVHDQQMYLFIVYTVIISVITLTVVLVTLKFLYTYAKYRQQLDLLNDLSIRK